MTTRIRLRRMGSNKRPFYRVVVADQRSPRDGRFIEIIGRYHPLNDPSVIQIDEDRALHWLMVGAQPSNQVRNLMTKVGIWERFVAQRPSAAGSIASKPDRPVRPKLSKKAQAKAAESAEAPEQPVETPTPAPEPESAAQQQEPEPPTQQEPGGSSPEAEPDGNGTVEPAAASSEPDAAPQTDTAGADVQETPEG
jgi:small subunit ribosomal protein S16